MAGFKTRVLSAIVLVAVLGTALYFGGAYLWALLLFLSLIGLFEFYRAMKPVDKRTGFGVNALEIMGYTGCILYYIVLFFTFSEKYLFFSLIGILIISMFAFVLKYPEYHSNMFMSDYFGIIYVCVTLSFVYMTRMKPGGEKTVWIIFISSWICDTCAYLVGVAIGKHKLVPKLSPKKSIEGAIGGVIGSALVGFIFARIVGDNAVNYMIIGAAGAVISQFGDLTASAIKRNHDIKDYGRLIPGHGGVLDRFDSVIITAPVVYILSEIITK